MKRVNIQILTLIIDFQKYPSPRLLEVKCIDTYRIKRTHPKICPKAK